MAKDYTCIYLNNGEEEILVRRYGGNSADVWLMRRKYERMTKEEFLAEHPKFAEKIGDEFKLIVD